MSSSKPFRTADTNDSHDYSRPALLETLEPRLMLDGAFSGGIDSFPTAVTRSWKMLDENDHPVTFVVSNAEATVYTEQADGGRILGVELQPANENAVLKIVGPYEVTVGDIVVYGSMKLLNAPRVNLSGDLAVDGWATKIVLGDLADGASVDILTDGAIVPPDNASLVFKADEIGTVDFSTGNLPIRNFRASSYIGGTLTAGAFGNVIVTGDFGPDATALDVDARGLSIVTLKTGSADGAGVTAPGGINRIVAADWTGGSISAGWIGAMTVGNRRDPADVTAALTLDGDHTPTNRPVLTSAVINGRLGDATWSIAGQARRIAVIGESDTLTLSDLTELDLLTVTDAVDTSITVAGDAGRLLATSWTGGGVDAESAALVRIKGDLSDGTFSFDKPVEDRARTLNNMTVLGEVTGTTIRSAGDVGVFNVSRMLDSALLVGVDPAYAEDADADGVLDLPGDPADFSAPVDGLTPTLHRLVVTGARGITDNLLDNATLATASLGAATIKNVRADSGGFFGVVYKNDLRRLVLGHNGRNYVHGASNWPDTGWFVVADVDENHPPKTTDDSLTAVEDTPTVSADVLANDADLNGDAFDVIAFTQATHGAVAYNGAGVFSYSPAADYNGLDSFTYTIEDDGGAQTTGTVRVSVSAVNDAPRPTADSYVTDEDTVLQITDALANDSDVEGDAFSIVAFSQASHGSVSRVGSVFTYTPDADYSGADSFTYTLRDSQGASAATTVSITVTGINDAPTAVADSYSVNEDAVLTTGDVTANDSDVEGDAFDITDFTQATHGSVTYNGDGAFTYTPQANFHGTDSFTYTIADAASAESTATVTITVNAVNDAPVAADDEDYTTVNHARTIDNVLANDTDADGDLLTVFSHTQGAHGSVVDNGDGTFTYTPQADYSGVDSFTYTVTDSNGGADTATVTITVNDVPNNLPQGVNDSYTSYYNDAFTTGDVLANDTDADGHTLSVTGFTQATHGVVTYNDDGTFTYTLSDYFAGNDTFTYTVSDGHGGADTATVTITKPEITLDVLGAPSFGGSEISSLRVYRLRATRASGDNFDTFGLDAVANTHQVWANSGQTSTYSQFTGITEAQNALDTHFLFDATQQDLSMGMNETNDGSNPTGGDYSDGGVTPYVGLGSFEILAMSVLEQFVSIEEVGISFPFAQIVLPTTAAVTLSGSAIKTLNTTYFAEFSFTIEATEDPGPNNAPVAVDESYSTYRNEPYTTGALLANDTDADGDELSITGFTQPSHGAVTDNGDGTFTYTATEVFVGDDSFTYTISDGNGGSDTGTVTITKPKITIDNLGAPTLGGVEVDGLTVYRLRATALQGEDLFDTFAMDEIAGVHQVWADGATATTYADMTGLDADYSDLDTHVLFNQADVFMSFGMTETNDASDPASLSIGPAVAGVGTFEMTTESIFGVDLSIQFMQIVVPDALNLTVTGSAAQGVSVLDFSIQIVASDDAAPNSAPNAADDGFTAVVNTDYTTTNVLANDTDADGHTLTITDFTQPSHGTVVYNDDGTFTYAMSEYFAGDDVFSYTVSDGHGATDTATVTITKPEVTLDVLGAPSFGGSEISSLRVYRLRATNLDGDNFDMFGLDEVADVFQVWANSGQKSLYSRYTGLTEAQNALDTHFMFDATQQDFSLGMEETNDGTNPTGGDYSDAGVTPYVGLGSFEILAMSLQAAHTAPSMQFAQIVLPTDVGATLSGSAIKSINTTYQAEFSITIDAEDAPGPNTAPSATDEAYQTYKNEPYTTANVLANDTDADNDTLSVQSFTQPSHGTVVHNGDGTFTYTLSEHYVGTDSFTYTVTDGRGGADTGTVSITKPKITLDKLGAPTLDGVEVPGLTVYRLRCTADDGEDYFDTFQIYEIANTLQVWGLGNAQTTRLDAGLLDTDWLDFDTHMLVSSADSPLSFGLSETNDGSNPSGQTFDNGAITGTAGVGAFEVQAMAVSTLAIPGQSYQFLQVVVRNTDTVTVSGVAIQVSAPPTISFAITLD